MKHFPQKFLRSLATLVTPQTIDTIVDSAKQEAQEWLSQVKEKAKEYNKRILEKHTLLASIKMPIDLFIGKSSVSLSF